MRRAFLSLLGAILLVAAAFAQDTPDWAMREYAASASQVYAAALKSIAIQKHEIKTKNDQSFSVDFHVGITAWSWGYNMRLNVTPLGDNRSKVIVGVLRSGGKAFSWGSGRKEVAKILGGIDADLSSGNVGPLGPGHRREWDEATTARCILEVTSEPTSADVELDGKFVGNTPVNLRLDPGDYTIAVKKSGYVRWERKVSAMTDNTLAIRAELEKSQ